MITSYRSAGRLLRPLAASATAAALLLTGVVPAASAASRPRPARPAGQRRPGGPGGRGLALSAAAAAARARRTGRPVAVAAMTTPSSATVASPDGTLTVTESLQPVRAWRDGAWASLNPRLHVNGDGTISPEVTTAGLVLSGGGTGPLAVMSQGGRSLTLSWPGRLPAPVLSGATATYPGVLPGVSLVVTVTAQGGFSEVLVIKNARAAADPGLAALRLITSSPNLMVAAGPDGGLAAKAGRTAPPVFAAPPPLMWDSAAPSARVPARAGPGGTAVTPAGLPAYSTVTAPGAAAHVRRVPVTVHGHVIALAVSAAALSGHGVVYPVYVDPTWIPVSANASNWTEVVSGHPTSAGDWRESSDLQVGYCDFAGCAGIGVARSFFTMPIPQALTSTTTVDSADLYTTDQWAPSCTATDDELWTTNGISSSTDWNNQPAWLAEMQEKAFAYGYSSSCGYKKDDVTWSSSALTAAMQRAASQNFNAQTFGLRAASESDKSQWKQFLSGSTNITLSVTYADPPSQPSDLSTNPGGSCQTSSAHPALIGNDDVAFSAYVSDTTGNSLTTRYVITNSAGTVVYDSASKGTSVSTGSKSTAELTLTRSQMQALQSGGATTQYTYHWYAVSTNDDNMTGPQSQTCYFTYNPAAPSAPVVTVPSSGALGQQVAATFDEPPGCGASGSPCPVSYTYQLGAGAPVTVSANSSGDWSGNITVTRIGPIQLTVYCSAAGGNPGEAAVTSLTGTPPATPYQDGYFTSDPYPDVLTIGTGTHPSLWLDSGSGNGTLFPPSDIGSLGTTINPGADGPADWAGAIVAHGDFTGDGVQDVLAYYPAGAHQGTGIVIGGTGDGSPLVPAAGNVSTVSAGLMASGNTGDDPLDLVGAGNASEIGTGTDDLIGISGDAGNGYELDLYTNGLCAGCAYPGGYAWDTALSTQAPDGTNDWKNYLGGLATAQPGANPDNTVLFALDSATGALYESVNPGDSTSAIIGTGNWTKITVPWGASPPTLLSADVNQGGLPELWTESGSTVTAYTLSSGALSKESSQAYAAADGEWPLTDGSPYAQTSSATTAVDTAGGHTASLKGGASWGQDDYFSTDVSLDGSTGYLSPPAGTIPASDTTPKISIWFRTTTPGGVLVSEQSSPPSSGATISGGYDPVLYIGTDGKLYAEWWNGTLGPAVSASPVDDGLWHHAILTAYANSQSLYVDNQPTINFQGSVSLGTSTNLAFGTGYIGGSWPAETHYKQNGSTGYLSYFTGQIADVIYSYPGGP